jgi:translation machinery-associated protein 16
VDVYGFFFHAMPESGVLTLEELHSIVKDVWLTRHDVGLEEERVTRRKGRPKSMKEAKLEEIKLRAEEEYRTGMGSPLDLHPVIQLIFLFHIEIPDLTHPETVALFRRWDQKEVAFMQLLRFIRIFRDQPEVSIVSRPGKHFTLLPKADSVMDGEGRLEEQAIVQWTPPGEFLGKSQLNVFSNAF